MAIGPLTVPPPATEKFSRCGRSHRFKMHTIPQVLNPSGEPIDSELPTDRNSKRHFTLALRRAPPGAPERPPRAATPRPAPGRRLCRGMTPIHTMLAQRRDDCPTPLGLLALPHPPVLLMSDKASSLTCRRRPRYQDAILSPGGGGSEGVLLQTPRQKCRLNFRLLSRDRKSNEQFTWCN